MGTRSPFLISDFIHRTNVCICIWIWYKNVLCIWDDEMMMMNNNNSMYYMDGAPTVSFVRWLTHVHSYAHTSLISILNRIENFVCEILHKTTTTSPRSIWMRWPFVWSTDHHSAHIWMFSGRPVGRWHHFVLQLLFGQWFWWSRTHTHTRALAVNMNACAHTNPNIHKYTLIRVCIDCLADCRNNGYLSNRHTNAQPPTHTRKEIITTTSVYIHGKLQLSITAIAYCFICVYKGAIH